MTAYPKPAAGAPKFPALELDVLDYWGSDDTFRASIARRDGAPEYVFYDGPPFANGLPHYGHLLTGYVKDIVPRYRTMRGYKVERRFGWDTHGLPAELEVQRQLGITDKAQIEEMGIEKFNDACRASVLKYTNEWRAYVTRQARWVDFDNDYKTLDPTFMESVIWAFKQLWDKGLAYEGNRVLPYCWNDETPLSSHELRMDDDVYQSRQDPAITVGFRVSEGDDKRLVGAFLLIWTTTPWTLPSNQAVAVNPDVAYVLVAGPDGRRYVLAQARLSAYARELGDEPEVLATYTGRDLLATRYLPPFPYFMDAPNSFRVLPAEFVSTEDGTGIVHMSPAYGEDDMAITQAAGIPAVTPVDSKGRFDETVPDYAGQHVFDANPQIIRDLKNQGRSAAANGAVLLRHETYEHSYPHCWRCRNPLIYRAVSSWFIKVTEFRDRMVELNQQITWYPEHVKDGQFGKWLSNARDWSSLAKPLLGQHRFRSGSPTIPRIHASTSMAASTNWSATSACDSTDLHRPLHRRADPAQPGRPDRQLDDAAHRGCVRRVVRLGVDAVRPGALPVRKSRVVPGWAAGDDRALPCRLHRRVHRPDAGLVLSAARACHRPVRPAGVQNLCGARDRARQRRPEDEQVAAQLSRRDRGVRPRRLRRHAVVPDGLADPARRQPDRHRAGHPRGCPAGVVAAVERLQLPRAVRARRRAPGAPTRSTCSTATSWPSWPSCAHV